MEHTLMQTPTEEQESIQLRRVTIKNILGIEDLEFDLKGGCTIIEGDNGFGKSSVLNAIGAVLEGGEQVQLLRDGAEKGEIVILFDNGIQAKKTVTQNGSTLKVTDERNRVITKGQSYLQGITDVLANNPVKFLTADAKGRVKYLLDTIPFELSDDQLIRLTDADIDTADLKALEGTNSLDTINKIRKDLYEQRTDVNRAERSCSSSVERLSQSLPTEDENTDWSQKINGIEEALQLAQSEFNAVSKKHNERYKALRENVKTSAAGRISAIDAEYDAKLAELNQWRDTEKTQVNEDLLANIEEYDMADDSDKLLIDNEHQPKLTTLRDELQQAKNKREEFIRFDSVREQIKTYKREATEHAAKSEALTVKIDLIDVIREELITSIPIKGLEVYDGDIYLDGIIWDRLNTAQQYSVAVQLALIRAGMLKLVRLDNLEHFTPRNRMLLLKMVHAAGLSVLGTVVAESELSVNHLAIN